MDACSGVVRKSQGMRYPRSMRNAGKDIDIGRKVVRDRDGLWHPVDTMQVSGGVLYYARPVPAEHFNYHELWAFPEQDWVVSRLHFHPDAPDPIDWYIEPDLVDVTGDMWAIRDAYLDVCAFEGSHYRLEDAGELAEGLASGAITLPEAVRALEALDRLLAVLERNGNSGAALLRELAPGLPNPFS